MDINSVIKYLNTIVTEAKNDKDLETETFCKQLSKWLTRLLDLETAMEKGDYLKSPCKSGDYLYVVFKGITGYEIARYEIAGVKIRKDGVHFTVFDLNSYGVRTGYKFELDERLGEQAFLNEAAAKEKYEILISREQK